MNNKKFWKIANIIESVQMLLLLVTSSSLLILGHVLPMALPTTTALAHSNHHHQHHHHPYNHHSAGKTDGGKAPITFLDEEKTSSNTLPWSIPASARNGKRGKGPCRYKRCSVGKECRVESSGVAQCICISQCNKKGGRKSNSEPYSTQQQWSPKYHHLQENGEKDSYNHDLKEEDDSYYQQDQQRDFTFGVYDGDISNKNGSGKPHKHNIIPDSGGLRYHQRNSQQQQNHIHREKLHQMKSSYKHLHDPDKNPLRDKNQGFTQTQSSQFHHHTHLSPSTSSSSVDQHTIFYGKKEKDYDKNMKDLNLYFGDDDDPDADQEHSINYDDPNNQNSMHSMDLRTNRDFQHILTDNNKEYLLNEQEQSKGEKESGIEDDNIDNVSKEITNNRGRFQKNQTRGRPQYHSVKAAASKLHYLTASDNPELKKRNKKLSSKRFSNGGKGYGVDSDRRQILDDVGHSSEKNVLAQSSYYNFMKKEPNEVSTEDDYYEEEKIASGMTQKKLEFSWRKDESGQEDEMSDQAYSLHHHDEKSEETLEPSAGTNPAWKSPFFQQRQKQRQEREEISERKGFYGEDAPKDGHWNDGDHPPVKKDSSFPEKLGNNDDGFKDEEGSSAAATFRQQQSPSSSFYKEVSSSSKRSNGALQPPPPTAVTSVPKRTICSPQDYEILKGELFGYDMSKLMKHIKMMMMTSVPNEVVLSSTPAANGGFDDDGFGQYMRNAGIAVDKSGSDDAASAPWSDMIMSSEAISSPSSPPAPWLTSVEGDGPEADKDNLLRHIFTILDKNRDNILEYVELYKAELENRLELRTPDKTGCQFRDFLLFDDTDHDGQLHVNEFFSSFSHFYAITMLSLDKPLETKTTRVVEGDTVLLRCDITGSPPPYIQWKRYGTEVKQLAKELAIKTNIDGSLSLTNVHIVAAGHFTCQSPRNPEVVQTHILTVETLPFVEITPKASWKRPGEDLLLICSILSPTVDSSVEDEGKFLNGQDTSSTLEKGLVKWTWLFNGIPLRELPKSSSSSSSDNNNNNHKYIFENSSSASARGGAYGDINISRLRIQEIYFLDMGTYSCQAENKAGIGTAASSLVVIDPNSKPEMQALHNTNARQLLVFHRNGVASYSAEHCGWLWEIFGDDVIQLPREKDGAQAVCDQFHSLCDWGDAIQVSPNYVYALQPSSNRLVLIDVGAVQSVGNALASIGTCRNPVKMEYVPYTDQLWITCRAIEIIDNKRPTPASTVFTVVDDASKGIGDHHQNNKAIQFPLQKWDASGRGLERITGIFLPAHQDGKLRGRKDCQFGYIFLQEEQFLQKIDLKTFAYHKDKSSHLNLTKFSCIPHQLHFSLSCTISIINCLDPISKSPNGQLLVDTLSNTVRFKTEEVSGSSISSSDGRILLTEKQAGNTTYVFVQRVGVYDVSLLSHFLISKNITNVRIVHSMLTGAYASIAKLASGKEAVLSLQTGELQTADNLFSQVPHFSQPTSDFYSVDNSFPLRKTEKSVIVMNAETLRPRCKFYEEIPELQSFLTVQS